MLKFMQNLLTPKISPIGLDIGSEFLRMAQVQVIDGEPRLVAASSMMIPLGARKDPSARLVFLAESCRALYEKGGFAGKQIVIGLPTSMMYVQHLRLPKMDEDSVRKALPWEAKGKIPVDPGQAMLRHVVAGEVFQDQESRLEVILMAVKRDTVEQILRAVEGAKLDVTNLQTEPWAIVNCYHQVLRKRPESKLTIMYIDIGLSGTRAMVSSANQLLFLRLIPIGGDQFNYAASVALKVPVHEARNRRIQQASVGESGSDDVNTDTDPMAAKRQAERAVINEACREPLDRLLTELELCRRYHEATFPNRPIDLIVFVGGEARQRALCQQIARRLGIAAQLGDPMPCFGRMSKLGADSGVNVNQPQPDWSVAIGLSMI